MSKTYRTAQGKMLDIEKLRLQNELTPAIGNMRVNARGDQLGPGGKVVKSREKMLDDHYKTNVSRRNPEDNIPTKGGKAQRIEKFEPGAIEPDPTPVDPAIDDFVDPEPVAKTGGLAKATAKKKK